MVSQDVLFNKTSKVFGFMTDPEVVVENCDATAFITEVRHKTELLWEQTEHVRNTSKSIFVIPGLQFSRNESFANTFALNSDGTVCSHLDYEVCN